MAVTVRWACGHPGTVSETADGAPVCACGERRVVATHARAPRFVGLVSGPYAETRALGAVPINLAPKGPLVLTPQE